MDFKKYKKVWLTLLFLIIPIAFIWTPSIAMHDTSLARDDDFVIPIIVTIFLVILLVSLILYYIWKNTKRDKQLMEQEINRQKQMESIGFNNVDNMSPYEFEEWIACLMRSYGYNAYTTKKSQDFGVDIIAESGPTKIAIQAKKYSGAVGVEAVQQIASGKQFYDCTEAWIMTTSQSFTQSAWEMAKKLDVKLFNRDCMIAVLAQKHNASDNK
ncbi:MAG: restriction endonuclease [Clostridia bacterium]|nr:restriction endonuclease [Clostridia bacterium]